MKTTQYYTTRRNSNTGIEVLEELMASNYISLESYQFGATSYTNYVGLGIKLTEKPIPGQLIVITQQLFGFNITAGIDAIHRPIVGSVEIPATVFNLACVGGVLDAGIGQRSYQTAIWYRVADSYDVTAWNSGGGYSAWYLNTGAGVAFGTMTVTHLSRGNYWSTPIDSTAYYGSGSGAYVNSNAATSSIVAGSPSGVNVTQGGVVIATCSRNDSDVVPTVNNSFTIPLQYTYDSPNMGLFYARRNYSTTETNQNTTFAFSESSETATAIAAFNP